MPGLVTHIVRHEQDQFVLDFGAFSTRHGEEHGPNTRHTCRRHRRRTWAEVIEGHVCGLNSFIVTAGDGITWSRQIVARLKSPQPSLEEHCYCQPRLRTLNLRASGRDRRERDEPRLRQPRG